MNDSRSSVDQIKLQANTDVVFSDFDTGDNRLKIADNGDISFYEDTGTTAKLFWDASAERLGIGTTSPGRTVEVYSGQPALKFNNGTNAFTIGTGGFVDGSNSLVFFDEGVGERMRMDSSGNLLVGTTDTALYNNSANSTADNGALLTGGRIDVAKYNGTPMNVNRTGADGSLINFQKSGAGVGSIGIADSGDRIYLAGPGLEGVGIDNGANSFVPTSETGAFKDGHLSLGQAGARFTNLYLSGTATAARGIGATHTTSLNGTQTPNFTTYTNFVWTLTGNVTLGNPSTEAVGQSGVFVFIHSGAARTVSLGSEYKTVGGAGLTLSGAANSIDVIPYFVRATNNIVLGQPLLAVS